MTALPPLRDVLNNTPANAVDVDYNFKALQSHVGSELINRDGSVAMTGPLSLSGPPTAPQHATTKAYVDTNVVPVGVIWEFAGTAAPAGWAFCDGSSKTTTDPAYAALFAVIGYRHGGSGPNFNLPDRRARVPVGYSAGDAVAGTLGAKGGSRDAALAGHFHTVQAHAHDLSNHQHLTRHTHGLLTSGDDAAQRHVHTLSSPGLFAHGQNGTLGHNTVAAGTGNTFIELNAQNTSFNNSNHTHSVNIPEISAWSETINNNSSGQASPGTDTRGVTPTNLNYPLYEVVNYIIRIG